MKIVYAFSFGVLLTSALRVLVNDSKLEMIDEFYVEKVTFLLF